MATEDQNLDNYAELQEKLITSKIKKLQPNDITECIECGEEINPLRKKAIPSATRCIDCEELQPSGKQ